MKFIKEEMSANGNTRHMFALGKAEALILLRLLQKAIQYMPKTFVTRTTEQRMRDMRNEIRNSIPQMKEQEDDYGSKNYENL